MAIGGFVSLFVSPSIPSQPMPTPTGLFERNGHYYLRLIIPANRRHLFNGRTRLVQSLHTCHKRQAILVATMLRAELLSKLLSQSPTANIQIGRTATQPKQPTRSLRDVFNRWCESKHRSKDSIQACQRALCLFEELTPKKPIPPRVGRLQFRQLSGISQPVRHRAEPFQSEFDALMVVAVDVILHACFKFINAIWWCNMKILGL